MIEVGERKVPELTVKIVYLECNFFINFSFIQYINLKLYIMYWIWRNLISEVLRLSPVIRTSIWFLEIEHKYDSIQLKKWQSKHERLKSKLNNL